MDQSFPSGPALSLRGIAQIQQWRDAISDGGSVFLMRQMPKIRQDLILCIRQ
jgi:hypothetical protein